MRMTARLAMVTAVSLGLVLGLADRGRTDEGGWVDLTNLDSWKSPVDHWSEVGSAGLDPKQAKSLAVEAGSGVIYNGPTGRGSNLISKQSFGDVEVHLEFNVPKGSNSGLKFHSVYEVQVFDSHGTTKKLTGRECGGIYSRSEDKPKYHAIDDGYAPSSNACKPPGEWQTLDLTFLAPRFDASGKKVDCARITAVLNGTKVQDNVEVHSPTGAAWREPEKPTGPILLQGDHGPVAFRNIKARNLPRKP